MFSYMVDSTTTEKAETESNLSDASLKDLQSSPPTQEAPTQSPNLIEQADTIAKRIEEGNKKFEELIIRQEEAIAKSMLAGRSQAGEQVKSSEEKEQEELKKQVDDTLNRFR